MEPAIRAASTVTEPGAYRMPATAYHADPCPAPSLSNSIAQLLIDATPAHARYAHPRLNPTRPPDEGSRRTALGSACHRLLLGAGEMLCPIDFDDYRKKEAQMLRDEATARGATPILVGQLEEAERIVEAARGQLPAGVLEGGDAEVVVVADDLGTWLRSMLDWWSADRLTVVDYKTTSGLATLSAFAAQIGRMGYDVQEAFYQRAIGAAFPELAGRLEFLFVVQEIAPPYLLSTFKVSEADLSVAARKVDAAVAAWSHCMKTETWPGYPRAVQWIQLPEWHTRQWLDRELAENGDDPLWAFAGVTR